MILSVTLLVILLMLTVRLFRLLLLMLKITASVPSMVLLLVTLFCVAYGNEEEAAKLILQKASVVCVATVDHKLGRAMNPSPRKTTWLGVPIVVSFYSSAKW